MPRIAVPAFSSFAKGATAVLCGSRPAPILAAVFGTLLLAGAAQASGTDLRVEAPSGHSLAEAASSVPSVPDLYTVALMSAPAAPPSDEIVAVAVAAVSSAMASDEAGDAFLATYDAMSKDCARNGSVPSRCVLRAPGVVFDFSAGSYVVGRGDAPAGPDGLAGIGSVVAEDVAGRFVLRDPAWVEVRSAGENETYPADSTAF